MKYPDKPHNDAEPQIENLLKLARTKSELIELVDMLHRRNLRLQAVRNQLAGELARICQMKGND